MTDYKLRIIINNNCSKKVERIMYVHIEKFLSVYTITAFEETGKHIYIGCSSSKEIATREGQKIYDASEFDLLSVEVFLE